MSNSDPHILRKHSDFLTGLNESELEQLVRDGKQMNVSAGEVVLETGQEVEEAYLLLEGMLAVLVPRDWGESRIPLHGGGSGADGQPSAVPAQKHV
jgi:CRP-like cAMP-binding protein